MAGTERLTAAQAVVRYLQVQHSERDGARRRLIGGMYGIFGHGNVAGLGEALDEYGHELPFHQAKNEQSMVHAAMGYAKANNRLATLACTASIGPGSTNMVTGAATATINRVPVLLFASDIYAHRRPGVVLQQLENPLGGDVSVNDCFRPVSAYFDRISRPEQLLTALPEAMRVLTDPAATGAVTIAFPQDVQGEAFDYPLRLFEERVWHVARRAPDAGEIARAAEALASAKRPMIIAGGGVRYSGAADELRAFSAEFGVPVGETHAGKGVVGSSEILLGGNGLEGTGASARIAGRADVVLCVGTRLTDFATASRSMFHDPNVRFVAINVHSGDAHKMSATPVVADAKLALAALTEALRERRWKANDGYVSEARETVNDWLARFQADIGHRQGELMSQGEIVAHVNRAAGQGDVVLAAAGTPPGEVLKGWDNASGSECLIEFGYSCMGHEIPAAIGVRMARPDAGEVYVVVGDGTYLMCPTELVTAVQEGLKVTVIVIDNAGFQCIRGLQEKTTGSANFGNEFRRLDAKTKRLDGEYVPVDYVMNAESMGCRAWRAETPDELDKALAEARAETRPCVICVPSEPHRGSLRADVWWDVGVAEVSGLERVQRARKSWEDGQKAQTYLGA